MATWGLGISGQDLQAVYGFNLDESKGVFDAPVRTWTSIRIRGGAGTLRTTPVTEEGRLLRFTGSLTTVARTIAARVAAEDNLKDALRAGLLRITRTDGANIIRLIEGYGRVVAPEPVDHPINATDDRCAIEVDCIDAYWRDVEFSSRSVAAIDTPYAIPLGTAPSTGILRLSGTDPVITYRDAMGTPRATMTFDFDAAIANWVDVDMRLRRITKWLAGVASNGRSLLVSGDFPWAFDPQDGNFATSAWPTIETSNGGLEALWWRMFL